MPFPPQTKDANFDFEAILSSNVGLFPSLFVCNTHTDTMQRALEHHLNTTTDSIKLLKSSIRQEEKALALDTLELETLERDCKAAESLRRKHTKNVAFHHHCQIECAN